MTIGELIQSYLDEHDMSQRAFAAKCGGVTNGYISMLISGVNPHTGRPLKPSLEKLIAISRGLDMSVDDLFRTIDEMPVSLLPDPPEIDLAADELELLEMFRGFNASARADVLRFVRAMAGNPSMQKDDTTSRMA